MEGQEINPMDINNLLSDKVDIDASIPEDDYDEHGIGWQQTKRYAQDTRLRVSLTKWLQWLIPIWLFCVIAIVSVSMFLGHLDSSVLIALLTTTTVNILGLPYIVLKGLFEPKKDK